LRRKKKGGRKGRVAIFVRIAEKTAAASLLQKKKVSHTFNSREKGRKKSNFGCISWESRRGVVEKKVECLIDPCFGEKKESVYPVPRERTAENEGRGRASPSCLA